MSPRTMAPVVVLAALGCSVVVAAGPVQAAPGFGLSTDRSGSDGYAHAEGAVRFAGRSSVRIRVEITDRCGSGDGDGEGAYAWAQIRYADGTYDGGRLLNVAYDNNRCGNGTVSRSSSFDPGKPIRWVRVRLDESDGPSGPSSSVVYSAAKDNPFVTDR